MNVPEIHYARSGDIAIAYQLAGRGPLDLVFVPTFSNLVFPWLNREWKAFYGRLASFSRLIMLDKRGTGLSDRPRDLGSLEARMDDIRAVLDAVGSERAALVGMGAGGQPCTMFAGHIPGANGGTGSRQHSRPRRKERGLPYGVEPDVWRGRLREIRERWGERSYFEQQALAVNPSADAEFVDWFVTCQRFCASPGAALTFFRVYGETDVRDVLSAVHVPTLVLYGASDRDQMLDAAHRVPDAQAVEVRNDGLGVFEDVARETQAFLAGKRADRVRDTLLTTVLFTDIVGSTGRVAELGDRRWGELLDRHHAAVRRALARFRGEEVDTAGDGFLATFDGPARAIRCACSITDEVRGLGITMRAGVHTGECELVGGKVAGIAVNIGARVAALAASDEVLVSQTVKDLVAGSEIEFEERGEHELTGVPGAWRLYAVLDA